MYATTTLMTAVLRWRGYIQPSHLPIPELLKFVLCANFSIVGMNIAKLSMIPVSCLFEVVFDKIRYSRDTKLSILVVLIGVGVCTVTDVSVNTKGFSCLYCSLGAPKCNSILADQCFYSCCMCHHLQRKYSLSSFNLLGHTAPTQAATLLILGPFLDYWLTNQRIDSFEFNLPSVVFIILSCSIAVGTNLSQFICIGRFPLLCVFPSIGPYETILVLILGFFLLLAKRTQCTCDNWYDHCCNGNDVARNASSKNLEGKSVAVILYHGTTLKSMKACQNLQKLMRRFSYLYHFKPTRKNQY
ncbi:hypothetical protein Leryth_019596 [Lithospermum erythrorhizon]|nr:hypothetical protein Leryth_019596 [Lithospermum erythrorhizon]